MIIDILAGEAAFLQQIIFCVMNGLVLCCGVGITVLFVLFVSGDCITT